MDIKTVVNNYQQELIDKLSDLVSVNSEAGTPLPDAPFGAGPRDVLIKALAMLDADGFKTVNLDNYIGYAEWGTGDKTIGIIGHLDIVPAHKEDGWNTDPFKAEIIDGVMYGRGVADDKGAVVASMIALKALRDLGVEPKKRIRLIMGTNEETGSKGLAYYVEKEGHIDLGFTPDGDFPGVHGEKGMISAVYRSKATNLISIQGGTASNIVCRSCRVKVAKNSFSNKKLEDYFNNNNLVYTIEEQMDGVQIMVQGVSAHASTPQLGVNAISHALTGLKQAGLQDPFVEFYCSHFGLDTDGTGLGVKCDDEYGALTLNPGVIHMQDGVIEGTIDIRFPVTMTSSRVLKMMKDHLEDEGGILEVKHTMEPLYFPIDSPLVSKLLSAYQEVTGDTQTQPMTMGGGTYAKGIHNCIAFGCAFPNKEYHIHDANERVEVSELLLQAEIYAAAILELLEVE